MSANAIPVFWDLKHECWQVGELDYDGALVPVSELHWDENGLAWLPDFEGHQPRRCGEHRTVGWYRAWCYDCASWCHPSDGCAGCKPDVDDLMEEVDRLRVVVDAARATLDVTDLADTVQKREALRTALAALDGE